MSSHLFQNNQQQQQQYYKPDLQFYGTPVTNTFDGGLSGNMSSGNFNNNYGSNYMSSYTTYDGPWYHAFGTGGLEGEEPLLVELGINFNHILTKSLAVLNPFSKSIDAQLMDDTDLAGPLVFWGAFGLALLLSGKAQFGYIYGVALIGSLSIYSLLNVMSPQGIEASRVASVLGYCLLPMVILSIISVPFQMDNWIGYGLSAISTLWCTYSASGIFVIVQQMSEQRLLVAYPVGLLYACFALLSVFTEGVTTST